MNSKGSATRGHASQTGDTAAGHKPGLQARQVASKLLAAVVERGVSLDGLLDPKNGNPAYRALSEADRALVRAIVVATLRHLPSIEKRYHAHLKRPLPEGARSLAHILSTATAQIIHLDVPESAAVDLAVEQARRDRRSARFAGLVNAVLRKVAATPSPQEGERDTAAWFRDRLTEQYGKDTAQRIITAQGVEAPIDLTVKRDPDHWAARLGGFVLPTGTVRLPELDRPIPDLAGYACGEWWVQDAAASIPVRVMGDIAGLAVADLCAAPGGKTAQMAHAGARVTAYDLSENRLERLRANLARLSLSAECVAGDFMKMAPDAHYDLVLLDAPCSSTGTVRRHPDIPWTKSAEDVAKLSGLQERMLRRAVQLVRPGGRIVLSNCSLDHEEGERLVARVLDGTRDLETVPVRKENLRGLPDALTGEGWVRTTPAMLPHENPAAGGMDGSFVAVLRRIG